MEVSAELISGVRLRLQDLERRLTTTLARMSHEDLAWRPNAASNSAGNLVVHICGNLRQRYHAGLGGAPDDRNQDAEFAGAGPWARTGLIAMLERTFSEVDAMLASLPAARLGEKQEIRGTPTTVLDVLLRVVGHISEHVGQVVYIAKARQGDGFETLSIPRGNGR